MNSTEVTQSSQLYTNCRLCPRNCNIDRRSALGVCRCSDQLRAARAGLHFYEEPFLSGTNGSGTVFFSGCSLGCIYCQNGQISLENHGFNISIERLAEIFLEQQARKAHNINLVTGTHYTPSIACALEIAKANGLSIPVVWNSSGYEKPDTLKMLDGLVDIFLPDFKTLSPALGMKYMKAPDYPEYAREALSCMVHMTGDVIFESYDNSCHPYPSIPQADFPKTFPSFEISAELSDSPESGSGISAKLSGSQKSDSGILAELSGWPESGSGISTDLPGSTEPAYEGENVLMKRGVVVRHLMIPGQLEDSKNVIKYLYETYGDKIWISLMSQYTPVGIFAGSPVIPYRNTCPELFRKVSRDEYDELVDYAIDIGVENCMIQEEDVADDSFIPDFDGSGI